MERLFLSPPHMSGKELEYIHKVFESNYIAPLGEYVERFEQSVREFTGSHFALAVSSGTAAIHLALRVLGVDEGDIVLASTFTFIGSVVPILYQKAIPLFIDSDEKSWNLDPLLLEKAIHEAPKKPKALIVTHLYGQCADIEKIAALCKQHGIALIEDAAESLGAEFHTRQSGTFGEFGIYSFNGNKILTTSGGGMLVSHNEAYMNKAKFLATQARETALHYEHETYGYNYRMSNVLAAIGVAQMEVLNKRVEQCRQVFEWYRDELGSIEEITFMPELENTKGNRWLSTLTFAKTDVATVIQALEAVNAESRPLWKPMHLQPLFKEANCVLNGVSEVLFKQGLCVPSGSQMNREDVQRVTNVIKECC